MRNCYNQNKKQITSAFDSGDTCNIETLEPRLLLSGTLQYSPPMQISSAIAQVFSQYQGPIQAPLPPVNATIYNSPSVDWSTYLGGHGDDRGYAVDTDSQNNILVAGYTNSSDFAADQHNGNKDIFIVKFSNSGQMIWSTFLGGKKKDVAYGLAVDNNDNVIITGYTDSKDWISGGFDTTYNGKKDAFVVKLDSSGQQLWSTYLGGKKEDQAYDVAIDSNNDILITGFTKSADLAGNGRQGDKDAFVSKLSENGDFLWNNYLGGKKKDYGYGITVDSNDNVIATGYTDVKNWTSGGFDTSYNGKKDAFVVKFDLAGQHLWSTYLGGDKEDKAYDIAVDSNDNILITGYTKSDDLPNRTNDHSEDAKDAFVSKLSETGDIVWSTYIGGDEEDKGQAITVDSDDNVLITGYSKSQFLNDDYVEHHNHDDDDDDRNDDDDDGDDDDGHKKKNDKNAFIAQLNDAGENTWNFFIEGGSEEDKGQGIAVDNQNNPIIIGYTKSKDLVQNGYDTTFNGDKDAFVVKFDGSDTPPPTQLPEIDVELPTQPDNVHYYDFGSITLGQNAQVIFTIRNQGDAPLVIYDANTINSPFTITPINGPGNADDWTIQPLNTLDFTVYFTPTAPGDYNDQLALVNNDSDESMYSITLNASAQTTPLTPPEIEVLQQTTLLIDGDPSPVNFGSISQGNTARQLSFTINNLGEENLTLGQIQLNNNMDFQVTQQPAANLLASESTTFTIELLSDTEGTKLADVTFTNNDADENPFNFSITGNVTPVISNGLFVSDEFNTTILDTNLWNFIDPQNDSSMVVNGSQLELVVPASNAHDIWTDGNNSARIMQPTSNEDFQLEVKFDSPLIGEYAMQGIIVEQDPDNFLRLEFYSTSTNTNVMAVSFNANSPTFEFGPSPITPDLPMIMRVTRTGDNWLQEHSNNGIDWNTAANFNFTINVSSVGVYAANAGDMPTHTTKVDYFRNISNAPAQTASPSQSLLADFNNDEIVNLVDLDILGQNFGQSQFATHSLGDANGDGEVDLLDLDILGSIFN